MEDMMFVLDNQGRFMNYYQGPSKKDLYVIPSQFINKHFSDVMPPEVSEQIQSAKESIDASGEAQGIEYSLNIDNQQKWYHAVMSPYCNHKNDRVGIVAVVRNITNRKRMEETISRMALYDLVTDLPNRRLCFDRFELVRKTSIRNRKKAGLCVVDMDNFKQINDSFGHDIGDKALKEFGDRLCSLLRQSDTVARIGGDEFVILLPEIAGKEQLGIIVKKIKEAFGMPFQLDDHTIVCGISIGYSIFPDDGNEIAELYQKADAEMYKDKRQKAP
jgi:diguanylate cyclase (GGDEF)-like protein/PAS domain S-box-containing protein